MNDVTNHIPDAPADETPPADEHAAHAAPDDGAGPRVPAAEALADDLPPPAGDEPAATEAEAEAPADAEAAEAGVESPAAPADEAAPAAEPAPAPDSKRKWYVVKVASGREESIKAAIERKIRIEGLEEFLGQIVIPVEKVTEMRKARDGSTKRVVREHRGELPRDVDGLRQLEGVGEYTAGAVASIAFGVRAATALFERPLRLSENHARPLDHPAGYRVIPLMHPSTINIAGFHRVGLRSLDHYEAQLTELFRREFARLAVQRLLPLTTPTDTTRGADL